jgi:hypothetical protein
MRLDEEGQFVHKLLTEGQEVKKAALPSSDDAE